MNIHVLSCFEVQPRRRRGEVVPITDRKAFRLCIDEADRNRLLDESKWPDSVMISEWYFLDPAERRRRVFASQQRNDVIAPAVSAAVADREYVTLGSGERSVPGGPYDGHVAADRDDNNRDITAFSHVDDDSDNILC